VEDYLRKCKYCGVEATTIEELGLFCTNTSYKYNKMLECKCCRNKRIQTYYANNIEKLRTYSRSRSNTAEAKLKAITYKGGKCVDCDILADINNSVIFDFHHINPIKKEFTPSSILNHSWNKLTRELDKCVLLCSNCHRLRHANTR